MRIFRLAFFLLLPACAFGYETELPDAEEGAPKHITKNATFMVWAGDQYVTKVKGTNEFACLVLRDKKGRFEPSCLNKAAIESVLPVYEYQTKLLQQGREISDIHKKIEEKFNKGEFISPSPGALVYMMSKRNKFYNHFEKKLEDVAPHIMLYFPKIDGNSLGFNGAQGLPGFYNEYPHLSVIHIHAH